VLEAVGHLLSGVCIFLDPKPAASDAGVSKKKADNPDWLKQLLLC